MAKRRRFRMMNLRFVWLGMVVTTALVGSVGVANAAEPLAVSGPAQVTQATVPKVTVANDVVSARVSAKAQGVRVEVLSERTGTTRTWVNPNGSFTSEIASGIVRVKDASAADGWRGVDFKLQKNSDGTISPVSPVNGLVLNGGGVGSARQPLVTLSKDAKRSISLGWTGGDLPVPTIDGATATYKNVRHGADLVVQSTRMGFEQFLVLHKKPATTDEARVVMPITSRGLKLTDHGNSRLTVTDTAGNELGGVGTPIVNDATSDPATGEPSNISIADMAVKKVDGLTSLVVTPDAEYLKDAVYPVTIDPSVTIGDRAIISDTYVRSDAPTTSYLGDDELMLGTPNSGASKYRSYVKFKTLPTAGTQIVSATMKIYENYASMCDPNPFTVYPAAWIDFGLLTWNNQPALNTSIATTVNAAKGHGSACLPGWLTVDTKAHMQYWADKGDDVVQFGIRASETSTLGWKRFNSSEGANVPTLTVNYNRLPTTPTSQSLAPVTTVGTALFTTSTKPTFTAKSTDADANTVKVKTEIYTSKTVSAANLATSCTTALVASGSNASCAITTALADNKTYYARSMAYDSGGAASSSWSGWLTFTTAVAKPTTPTISCGTTHTNGSWESTLPTSPVTCTVAVAGTTASTAPTSMTAIVDGVTKTFAVASSGTTTGSLSVAAKDGSHTLTATTKSKVGTSSATASHTFGLGSGTIVSPTSGYKTTDTVTVNSSALPRGTSTAVTAQLQWSGPGVPWTDAGAAVDVTPSSATAPVTSEVSWDTTSASGGTINARQMTTLQLRMQYAYTGGAASTRTTPAVTVLRVPHAFDDGYPTAAGGEGTVALWTGEFSQEADDVLVSANDGALTIGRSYNSFAGPGNSVTGVFGPGWIAALEGSGAGYGSYEINDENTATATGAATLGSLTLAGPDGTNLSYRPPANANGPSPAGVYTAVDEDTRMVNNKVEIASDSSGGTLTVTQVDGTVSTWNLVAIGGVPTWTPSGVKSAGQQGSMTYSTDTQGRVTRILASVPGGVTCPASGPLNPGCSALNIIYATSTTPAGDYPGRVKEITSTTFDPDRTGAGGTPAPGIDTVTVASYSYDSGGKLVSFSDQLGRTTSYQYQSTSGLTLLTQTARPGSAAYIYSYDSTRHTLTTVQRDSATAGGTRATIASYAYSLSPTAAGMPDVTASQIAKWGQSRTPTKAFAVFDADHVPAAAPTSADLRFASLLFTDGDGYTVNTAVYGAGQWLLTDQEYDSNGNPSVELGPDSIHDAVQAAANGDTYVPNDDETVTRYLAKISGEENADPIVPEMTVPEDTWSAPYTASGTDGSVTLVRQHTHITYDEGAPNGNVIEATGKRYLLPTTITVGVTDAGNTSEVPGEALPADSKTLSIAKFGYNPIDGVAEDGPTSGWTLGQATSTTSVMANPADNLVTSRLFDANGDTIKTIVPGSNGSDANSTVTVSYSAGTNAAEPSCGNKPQWAGLHCWSGPAAVPTTGADLTDTRTMGYNRWLDPTQILETSGTGSATITRSTTNTYLSDGRLDLQAVAVTGLADSEDVATIKALYDSVSKVRVGTGALDATGSVSKTDFTTIDLWGRVTSYVNALGDETDTTYVAPNNPGAGNILTIATPLASNTYAYDGTDADGNIEHRGLATGLSVSGVGNYGAAYNLDGALVTQSLPAGLEQNLSYDVSGRVTEMSYSGNETDASGNVSTGMWLSFSRDYDPTGRVLHDWSPDGTSNTPTGYTKAYSYDGAGRLIEVNDAAGLGSGDNGCTVRRYAFDNHGDRTSLTATQSAAGCTPIGGTTTVATYAYDDQARQLSGKNDSGTYSYDALGRQTSIPAADAPNPAEGDITIGYFDTDAVHEIVQGGAMTTYALDPDGRRLRETSGPEGDAIAQSHYADGGDIPAWKTHTGPDARTVENSPSLGGGVAAQSISRQDGTAVSLSLPDVAGNVVASVPVSQTLDAPGISNYAIYDEFGNTVGQNDTSSSYGWLGAMMRAHDDSGLVLMGSRVYVPTTGRFTSVDPVVGGNENAYNYPNDPVNGMDPTGRATHNYSYQYAWFLGFSWAIGSRAHAFKVFVNAPSTIFPFPMSCKKFYTGQTCTLHASGYLPGFKGDGVVRVTVNTSSVKFTVIGKGYFDAPGSTVIFSVYQVGSSINLQQKAVAIGSTELVYQAWKAGAVYALWGVQAILFRAALVVYRWWW